MGKPRSDSLLKNLPEDRQEQIVEWCNTPKSDSCVGGYQFAREQLEADGLKVSLRVLSDFWSWWNLRQDLNVSDEVERAMVEQGGNPQQARVAAEGMFMRLSMARQDPKTFAAAAQAADRRQQLALDAGKLSIAERRIKLLEDNAAKAKEQLEAVKKTGGLSPEALQQIEEAAKFL